jgi:tetratricopeptide (TPR) repeat protein
MEWGAEQLTWLRRIERERDNLHAALAWAATGADLMVGQRMATALWRFWWQRGLMAQGRRWLDWALSLPASPDLRAKLLQIAGQFANWSGEMTAAQAYLEAALTSYRACDDTAEIAWTLHRLGLTIAELGDPDRGLALAEESVAVNRMLDDERGLAYALQTAGNVARMSGDRDRAEGYAEEALALCRASGNQLLTPYLLRQLMVVALARGDDARAGAFGEESLALAREIEDPHAITATLTDLLRLARRHHGLKETEARGREGLSVLRRIGANQYAETMLEIMAWAAAERGQPERAAAVLGAASAMRRSSGASRDVLDRSAYETTLAAVRAAVGDERFATAWARGQSLSLSAAIAEALPPVEPVSEHIAKIDAPRPIDVAHSGELCHSG